MYTVGMKARHIVVHMSDEEYQELKVRAVRDKISITDLVRKIILSFLGRSDKKK